MKPVKGKDFLGNSKEGRLSSSKSKKSRKSGPKKKPLEHVLDQLDSSKNVQHENEQKKSGFEHKNQNKENTLHKENERKVEPSTSNKTKNSANYDIVDSNVNFKTPLASNKKILEEVLDVNSRISFEERSDLSPCSTLTHSPSVYDGTTKAIQSYTNHYHHRYGFYKLDNKKDVIPFKSLNEVVHQNDNMFSLDVNSLDLSLDSALEELKKLNLNNDGTPNSDSVEVESFNEDTKRLDIFEEAAKQKYNEFLQNSVKEELGSLVTLDINSKLSKNESEKGESKVNKEDEKLDALEKDNFPENLTEEFENFQLQSPKYATDSKPKYRSSYPVTTQLQKLFNSPPGRNSSATLQKVGMDDKNMEANLNSSLIARGARKNASFLFSPNYIGRMNKLHRKKKKNKVCTDCMKATGNFELDEKYLSKENDDVKPVRIQRKKKLRYAYTSPQKKYQVPSSFVINEEKANINTNESKRRYLEEKSKRVSIELMEEGKTNTEKNNPKQKSLKDRSHAMIAEDLEEKEGNSKRTEQLQENNLMEMQESVSHVIAEKRDFLQVGATVSSIELQGKEVQEDDMKKSKEKYVNKEVEDIVSEEKEQKKVIKHNETEQQQKDIPAVIKNMQKENSESYIDSKSKKYSTSMQELNLVTSDSVPSEENSLKSKGTISSAVLDQSEPKDDKSEGKSVSIRSEETSLKSKGTSSSLSKRSVNSSLKVHFHEMLSMRTENFEQKLPVKLKPTTKPPHTIKVREEEEEKDIKVDLNKQDQRKPTFHRKKVEDIVSEKEEMKVRTTQKKIEENDTEQEELRLRLTRKPVKVALPEQDLPFQSVKLKPVPKSNKKSHDSNVGNEEVVKPIPSAKPTKLVNFIGTVDATKDPPTRKNVGQKTSVKNTTAPKIETRNISTKIEKSSTIPAQGLVSGRVAAYMSKTTSISEDSQVVEKETNSSPEPSNEVNDNIEFDKSHSPMIPNNNSNEKFEKPLEKSNSNDGRLKRTRVIKRKNPRRETTGSNVLAPQKSSLVNPMFRKKFQENILEISATGDNDDVSSTSSSENEDIFEATINSDLYSYLENTLAVKEDDFESLAKENLSQATPNGDSLLGEIGSKSKQNHDYFQSSIKRVSFSNDHQNKRNDSNASSNHHNIPKVPTYNKPKYHDIKDTMDYLLSSNNSTTSSILENPSPFEKENNSFVDLMNTSTSHDLCLSPVQRTPQQARKWRTLKAAVEEKDKQQSSAKKKLKRVLKESVGKNRLSQLSQAFL